jgi:hypothetical protein
VFCKVTVLLHHQQMVQLIVRDLLLLPQILQALTAQRNGISPNYTSSNYKSISANTVNERNATAVTMELAAILWSNTAAITSIALTPAAGNFAEHSTAYLIWRFKRLTNERKNNGN